MAHVTFIHGIANKPPADDLMRIWVRALADAVQPLSLSDSGVSTSMVYWADLLYETPVEDLSSFESTLENSPAAVDGAGNVPPPVPANAEEAKFLEALRAKLTHLSDAEIAAAATAEAAAPRTGATAATGAGAAGAPALERIPLPWFIKRQFMNAFLRDVHHYLFDVSYAPPGKAPPVRIQQTIRKRFVDALCAQDVSKPHIVVSHSMGTVVAYDCLKRVDLCNAVDGLITIGCPLGLDEVQDKLQPGWSRLDGFPGARVAGKWINLYDPMDPVCGFDPRLANDFLKTGLPGVEDIKIENDGWWRHSATKYLRQPKFSDSLRKMLEL
ncbi:MAG: hypothetical protein WDO56_18315 [Gammaproteobacteria bacterium]